MTTSPTITAIAPWFGGKRTLAADIVCELSDHSAYWEPFCGSMAVLFAKEPSGHETVNDLHGDLINLAMVVRNECCGDQLYSRLVRTLYNDTQFKQSQQIFRNGGPPELPPSGVHLGPEHVDRAYHYFVVSWMGRNGVSGSARINYQMAVRWTPGGGGGGKRFSAAVDSMPWWHQRLRNVCILRRDAFELLEKIEDCPGVAIYVDPPYFKATRGKSGGSRYLHDFTDADHDRLAASLARFEKARVVVSYYEDLRLENLYDGWTFRRMHCYKNLHVQNRRGSKKSLAPEILLLNGPSFAGDDQPGLWE